MKTQKRYSYLGVVIGFAASSCIDSSFFHSHGKKTAAVQALPFSINQNDPSSAVQVRTDALAFGDDFLQSMKSDLVAAGLSDDEATQVTTAASAELRKSVDALILGTNLTTEYKKPIFFALDVMKGATTALQAMNKANLIATAVGSVSGKMNSGKFENLSTTEVGDAFSTLTTNVSSQLTGEAAKSAATIMTDCTKSAVNNAPVGGDEKIQATQSIAAGAVVGLVNNTAVPTTVLLDTAKKTSEQAITSFSGKSTDNAKIAQVAAGIASATMIQLSATTSSTDASAAITVGVMHGAVQGLIKNVDATTAADGIGPITVAAINGMSKLGGDDAGKARIADLSSSVTQGAMAGIVGGATFSDAAKESAVGNVMQGVVSAFKTSNMMTNSTMAQTAVQAAAKGASSGLAQGAAGASLLGAVAKTTVSAVASVGMSDATTLQSIAQSVVQSVASEVGKVYKGDATELGQQISSITQGAINAMGVLQQSGIVSAAQLTTFGVNAADSAFKGVATVARGSVVQGIQVSVTNSVVNNLSSLGVTGSDLTTAQTNIGAAAQSATALADVLAAGNLKVCANILGDGMTNAKFASAFDGMAKPLFCSKPVTEPCVKPRRDDVLKRAFMANNFDDKCEVVEVAYNTDFVAPKACNHPDMVVPASESILQKFGVGNNLFQCKKVARTDACPTLDSDFISKYSINNFFDPMNSPNPPAVGLDVFCTINLPNTSGSGGANMPSITYAPTTFTFSVGQTIPAINPTLNSGSLTSCSVNPALPAGLVFNSSTCAITGTATAAVAAKDYSVTPANASGSGPIVKINITVNSLPVPTVSFNPATITFTKGAGSGSIIATASNTTSCALAPDSAALPAGASLGANCSISNFPFSTAQNYTTYKVIPSGGGISGAAALVQVRVIGAYGTGDDGDLNVSGSMSTVSTYGPNNKIISASRRVTAASGTSPNYTLTLGSSIAANGSEFAAGDEIMYVILGAGSTASLCASGVGMYGTGKVTAMNATSLTVKLAPDATGVSALTSANGVTFSTTNSSLCLVQVVRVPNFANVTVPGSANLTSQAFSPTSGQGGILAFRVNGTLTIDGWIAGRSGFPGGMGSSTGTVSPYTGQIGFPGAGALGQKSGTFDNNDVGGSGGFIYNTSSANAGANGGNGAGAIGGQGDGNKVQTVVRTATASTLLFGGGGGAGASYNSSYMPVNGGPGGGIVYILARNITGVGSIFADGAPGATINVTRTSDVGAAGGGGGTIFVGTYNPGTSNYRLDAHGGMGSSSGLSNSMAGAGGGGGSAFMRSCQAVNPNIVLDLLGGTYYSAGGYVPGTSQAGASGTPSIQQSASFCD